MSIIHQFTIMRQAAQIMTGRRTQIVRLAGEVFSGPSALSIGKAAGRSHAVVEPNADEHPQAMAELSPRFVSPIAVSVSLSDLRRL